MMIAFHGKIFLKNYFKSLFKYLDDKNILNGNQTGFHVTLAHTSYY